MFMFTKLCRHVVVAVASLATAYSAGAIAAGQTSYAGIGRASTAAEIKAWDIDVRPDFTGLPPGSGTVANGQKIWDAKCESCHGTFGESNAVFTPIAGGVSASDMGKGRTATLARPDFPQRSTLMKLAQVSTLWDYINRAMPWNAPKSLSVDEVYAVTAYVLHLGDIVPADFVLSEQTIRDVQSRLPNRDGMQLYASLWDVRGKGDVKNVRCMQNCPQQMTQLSAIPDFARNQHGNLAEQNRFIGPVRGTDTTKPPRLLPVAMPATTVAPPPAVVRLASGGPSARELAQKYTCSACHQSDRKLVGPSYAEIAAKYQGKEAAEALLMAKVRSGGSGVWGSNVMPPNAGISDEDLRALVRWSLSGGN